MRLELTADQQLLADTARAWVTAHESTDSRELWEEMAPLGWPGLVIPEAYGGAGAGMVAALALIGEALGRGALTTPLLTSSALAALPLVWAGAAAQADRLASLAAGEVIGTLALLEVGIRDEWSAVTMPGSGALRGSKILVPWGEAAGLILVATVDGVLIVGGDDPRVSFEPHESLGGDPLSVLELDGAAAELLTTELSIARRALDHIAVAELAYTVGLAERMLELSVEHAGSREQFGRPIGSFQAVAHRCADMRAEVDACRWLAYQAAWALDGDEMNGAEVSAALAYGKDALRRVARHAHQVHGAIGFSTEHPLHRYSTRAKAFELAWGSASHHRERLARAMGLKP